MNKRRQIADANPKNINSSVANIPQSPINVNHVNAEIRPAKSIIIGAGQPIPGQRTSISDLKSNGTKTTANVLLTKIEAIAQPSLPIEQTQMRPNGDNNVTSVEEFCPDGGTLDKGFLDDLPIIGNPDAKQTELNYDSDSDSNDNPLVAKFHDDPFDDITISNSTKLPLNMASKSEPKINPLAKNKKGTIPHDLGLILTTRRNSNSSDDNEIPHILKPNENSDGQSNEEFDSWLSDTNQRRSPEGGEDEASLPSIDKSINNKTTIDDINQIERLDINDPAEDSDKKEKSTTKPKKKKKDKKEKKEKSEKKRSKSKKSNADTLLSECKERPSHSDHNLADDDQYEAL